MKRRLAEQKNDNFVDSYFFLFLLDLIISSLKSSLNLLLDFVTKERIRKWSFLDPTTMFTEGLPSRMSFEKRIHQPSSQRTRNYQLNEHVCNSKRRISRNNIGLIEFGIPPLPHWPWYLNFFKMTTRAKQQVKIIIRHLLYFQHNHYTITRIQCRSPG